MSWLMCFFWYFFHSNGPPKEVVRRPSPDLELDVAHDKKPPSASRGSKRVSNVRPDTGEAKGKGAKKKPGSRAGASPQLATMPEDTLEYKEHSEMVK